jgi:hypothetical protein
MKALWLFLLGCAALNTCIAGELRDPMRPPQRALKPHGGAAGAPVVSALFIGATHRAAIVNGRLVHEGDRLGAYTIVAVLDDGIRYQSRGVEREQRLVATDSHIKKPAASVARLVNGGS